MLQKLQQLIPFEERTVGRREVLLPAGAVADRVFYIQSGILRESFVEDGKDVTVQFFFEGQAVASIESFWKEAPSEVSIEAVEPSALKVFKKADIQAFLERHPESGIDIAKFAYSRMINYYHLFLSRIKDSPEKRYQLLLEEHPEMVARIPQHYLASYLGITPVSLSRIRARK